jgi:hypothetical protein
MVPANRNTITVFVWSLKFEMFVTVGAKEQQARVFSEVEATNRKRNDTYKLIDEYFSHSTKLGLR